MDLNDQLSNSLKFEPIKRVDIVTEVTQRLVEYLLSGHLKPGDKIPPERELSEAIGIARSTLRESLKVLTVLGLIEVRHGAGTYLKKAESDLLPQVIEWGLLLGEKRTLDIMEARQKIEVITASLAARRRNERDIEELKNILSKMEGSLEKHQDYIENDIAFHVKIADIAGNTVLRDMIASMQGLLRTWIKSTLETVHSTTLSYQEHVLICKAIESGDEKMAAEAMEKHMTTTTIMIKKIIENEERATFDSDPQ